MSNFKKMNCEKFKKYGPLIIEIVTFIYCVVVFIIDIATIFAKGVTIINGGYYEVRDSTWQVGNGNMASKKLYVFKRSFNVSDCNISDSMGESRENYNKIVNKSTIVFFWISELSKLVLLLVSLYVEYRLYLEGGPKLNESNDTGCSGICNKVCESRWKCTWKLINKTIIATIFSIPAYSLASFDYTTPCLRTNYVLLLTDSSDLLAIYYVNIIFYIIVSFVIMIDQKTEWFSEFLSKKRNIIQDQLLDTLHSSYSKPS